MLFNINDKLRDDKTVSRRLYDAATTGNLQEINKFVSEGWDFYDFQWRCIRGHPVYTISLALRNGHPDCVRKLFSLSANTKTITNIDLLVEAANGGNEECIHLVHDYWLTKVRGRSSEDISALIAVLKSGDVPKVEEMLRDKSAFDHLGNLNRAMSATVLASLLILHKYPPSCLELLTSCGVNILSDGGTELSPLVWAVVCENIECLEFLVAEFKSTPKRRPPLNALKVAASLEKPTCLSMIVSISPSNKYCYLDAAFYAFYFGHYEHLLCLFKDNIHIESLSCDYKDFIMAAFRSKNIKCISMLIFSMQRSSFIQCLKNFDSDELHCLIASIDCLKLVLDTLEVDVNTPFHAGNTLLSVASEHGCLESVKLLLKRGADIHHRHNWSETPLHLAIHNFEVETARFLVQEGADVNKLDSNGETMIMWAIEKKDHKSLALLLELGASPDIVNRDRQTAVMCAVMEDDSVSLKLMIEAGADLEIQDKDRNTPIIWAAKHDCQKCLKLLLDSGANVNARDNNGQTALMLAAYREEYESLKMLLNGNMKVNANIQDNNGQTALMMAFGWMWKDGMQMLLQADTDLNIQTKDRKTILEAFLEYGGKNLSGASDYLNEKLKLLISAGADINFQNGNGETVLMRSIKDQSIWAVRTLLNAGAKTCLRNNDGQTALMIAVENGYSEVAGMMLASGADPNDQNLDRMTALMKATENSHVTILELLIDFGADLNCENKEGKTAVIIATMSSNYGSRVCLERLIRAGADLNHKTCEGETAIMWAIRNHCDTKTKMLVKAGAKLSVKNSVGLSVMEILASDLGEEHFEKFVRLLISFGIGPLKFDWEAYELKGRESFTPLGYAIANSMSQFVNYLISNLYFFPCDYKYFAGKQRHRFKHMLQEDTLEILGLPVMSLKTRSFITLSKHLSVTVIASPEQRPELVKNLAIPDKLKRDLTFGFLGKDSQ